MQDVKHQIIETRNWSNLMAERLGTAVQEQTARVGGEIRFTHQSILCKCIIMRAFKGLPRYQGATSLSWGYLVIMGLPRYHGATSLSRGYLVIMVLPRYHGATSLSWCYLVIMVLPRYHGATFPCTTISQQRLHITI